MPSFQINSFKFGLDTRRDVLTSVVGTLVTCENAHVNPGGEIEKRKAFVDFAANTNVLDSNGAVGTFGLEVTEAGLVTFGSALNFGASVTQGQPTLASALVGVTYQQLKHPTLTNDSSESYNASYHRMTAVVFSENFNGKAFVCAQFSDGRRFLYYDGSLVQHSANGMVLENRLDVADLSNDLDRQVEAIGWRSDANLDEVLAAENGSTLVKSPQTNYFTPISSETSSLGVVGVKRIDQNGSTVSGTKAVASFKVNVNTGPFFLSAPTQATATTPTIDLCGGGVSALGTATLTAARIARRLNDLTNVHGYTAVSVSDDVFVLAPIGYDVSLALNLTVTPDTDVAASSNPIAGVTAVVDPATLSIRGFGIAGRRITLSGEATCRAAGAGVFSFSWSEATPGSGAGFVIQNPSSATTAFTGEVVVDGAPLLGQFKCQVSVSGTVQATAFLSVIFRAET